MFDMKYFFNIPILCQELIIYPEKFHIKWKLLPVFCCLKFYLKQHLWLLPEMQAKTLLKAEHLLQYFILY